MSDTLDQKPIIGRKEQIGLIGLLLSEDSPLSILNLITFLVTVPFLLILTSFTFPLLVLYLFLLVRV